MPYRHTPRSVLYTGPVLAGIMGAAYLFGGNVRTDTPSFQAARAVAPMHDWGVVFLLGCVVLTVGLIVRNQRVLAGAYFIGGAMYTWWSALFAVQALTDKHASLVAWALYGIVAMTHFVVSYRCWVNRR